MQQEDAWEEKQTVIKTTLRARPWFKTYLETLVQATSELETRGSAVYTLALLRAHDTLGSNIPEEFFEQGFVTACIRSVSSNKQPVYAPNVQCLEFLREARQHVSPVTTFDFTGFVQLTNQLGRRYKTVILTSLTTHLLTRQKKTIRLTITNSYPKLTKSMMNFLVRRLVWEIAGEPSESKPDPARFKDKKIETVGLKLLNSPALAGCVRLHKNALHTDNFKCDSYDGYLTDQNIKKFPHRFFSYCVFLFKEIKINSEEDAKLPFQLIPQFTMKTRSITIGKEQLVEIMLSLAHPSEAGGGSTKLDTLELPFGPEDIPSKSDTAARKIHRDDEKGRQMSTLLVEKRRKLKELDEERVQKGLTDKKRKLKQVQFERCQVDIAKTMDKKDKALKGYQKGCLAAVQREKKRKEKQKKLQESIDVATAKLPGIAEKVQKSSALLVKKRLQLDKLDIERHREKQPKRRKLKHDQFEKCTLDMVKKKQAHEKVCQRYKKARSTVFKRKEECKEKCSFGNISGDQWRDYHGTLATHLFTQPGKKIPKYWNGVVTTDGVSVSWHIIKVTEKSHSKQTNSKLDILETNLFGSVKASDKPTQRGTHSKDFFIAPAGQLNVIAVDPGHVILIDAVREHSTHVEVPENCGSKKRRLLGQLAARNRTHFSLSNGHWANVCGRTSNKNLTLRLHRGINLQPAVDRLAQASSKVATFDEYLLHVHARLETMDKMKELSRLKNPRRRKFDCYRREQLAVQKLSKDLLEGCSGNSVVVWGNGGFGPTSRGHASAPNKRLRRLLSKYVPVVLSSEYRSSQRSACCHSKMSNRPSKKRVTVKQCLSCKTLLSRDVSAACVILDIFKFQRSGQTSELPEWIVN